MKLLIQLFLAICVSTGDYTESDHEQFELIVFVGSDWCTNCARLEKRILDKSDFKDYLREQHINLVVADFPQANLLPEKEMKRNALLAETYHFDGKYPGIVLSPVNSSDFRKISYGNESIGEMKEKIALRLNQLR